jgi:hypothetical protein
VRCSRMEKAAGQSKRRSEISRSPLFDLALPLCGSHLALLNWPARGAVKLDALAIPR